MQNSALMMELNAGLGLLFFLAFGLIYAAWFKRFRAAHGFLVLAWLVIGLSSASTLQTVEVGTAREIGPVVFSWLPWNLLMLAVLPASRLVSPLTLGVVICLVLELVLAGWLPPGVWSRLPDLNALLESNAPAGVASLVTPVEPLLVVLGSVAFFIRWQVADRTTELAMSMMCSLLLIGVMRTAMLPVAIAGASGVLFLGMLYATHRMAFVDALTGLPNRRSLDLSLASMPRRYSIAMIDIDHFKKINDRFGHDFGDQVLRMVAARLRRMGRLKPYRYGGEEFSILFLGAERSESAKAACEEVREAIADPPMAFRTPARPSIRPLNKEKHREKVPSLKVTVSIGLAGNESGNSPELVIEAADRALYRAKRAGRNRVVVAKS